MAESSAHPKLALMNTFPTLPTCSDTLKPSGRLARSHGIDSSFRTLVTLKPCCSQWRWTTPRRLPRRCGETTVRMLRLRVTVVLPVGSLRSVLHASRMGAPYAHFTGGWIVASVSSRIFSEPSPACCMFIFDAFCVCRTRWSPLFVCPGPASPGLRRQRRHQHRARHHLGPPHRGLVVVMRSP